jgi:hypothetical protein
VSPESNGREATLTTTHHMTINGDVGSRTTGTLIDTKGLNKGPTLLPPPPSPSSSSSTTTTTDMNGSMNGEHKEGRGRKRDATLSDSKPHVDSISMNMNGSGGHAKDNGNDHVSSTSISTRRTRRKLSTTKVTKTDGNRDVVDLSEDPPSIPSRLASLRSHKTFTKTGH